jgi:hypothetical protein
MADEMCASVLMSQEAERLCDYRRWDDVVGPAGCQPARLKQTSPTAPKGSTTLRHQTSITNELQYLQR